MKKVLVILLLAVMLVSVCACSYVPSTKFMSRSKVNALVKEFETPQAELTLIYTTGGKEIEVKITYNLLLSQAPLAVIRFIQLANEGFYNDTVIDTYNSTYHYMIMGRYAYRQSVVDAEKSKYFVNKSDITFKGEFKSNEYSEPKEGYAQFSMLSLAMYHDESTDENNNFDTAYGALIMALSKETLNPNNYAVFAAMESLTYKVGDNEPNTYTKVPSILLANLTSSPFTSRTSSNKVYADATEETYTQPSMLNVRATISVKILGNYDWSKLPEIR